MEDRVALQASTSVMSNINNGSLVATSSLQPRSSTTHDLKISSPSSTVTLYAKRNLDSTMEKTKMKGAARALVKKGAQEGANKTTAPTFNAPAGAPGQSLTLMKLPLEVKVKICKYSLHTDIIPTSCC